MKDADPQKRDLPGTEACYESLYRLYFPRLFNFALQFTRETEQAEDLVQEVFLKLWEREEEIDPDRVGGLLFKMTRNLCLNYVQHVRVVQNAENDLSKLRQWEELYRIEFIRDEPYVLIEKELDEKIKDTLHRLPDRCREVFQLSRLEGLKNREIADRLNISLKTVEKHIHQALETFRKELPILIPFELILLVISN